MTAANERGDAPARASLQGSQNYSGEPLTYPHAPAESSADSITFLVALGGRVLAKRILPDGEIVGYDRAWLVKPLVRTGIKDIGALARLVGCMLSKRDICVVRGDVAPGANKHAMRRLVHDDPETGEKATLVDAPRRWLALDFDDVPLREGWPREDLERWAGAAAAMLPAAFYGRAYFATATASHGLPGKGGRVRLWYWLDRPTWGRELKVWLRGVPVDHALFSAAQVIYTAAPIFESGSDFMPSRVALIDGLPFVPVPAPEALAPPPRHFQTTPGGVYVPSGPLTRRGAWRAMSRGTARIACAAEGDRHATLLRVACHLAQFVRAGALTENLARAALADALEEARKPRAEADAVFTWAMLRAGGVS